MVKKDALKQMIKTALDKRTVFIYGYQFARVTIGGVRLVGERLWGNGEEGDYNATKTGLMLKEFC